METTPLWFFDLAIGSALLSSLTFLTLYAYPTLARYLGFFLLTLSGLAATIVGSSLLIDPMLITTHWALGPPWLNWNLRLDALSGFFLLLVGLVTIAIGSYGPAYIREFEHGPYSLSTLGLFTGLFITGMQLVLVADDAFMFMVSWELMSLSSYFLVAYQHFNSTNRRSALLYLFMAHLGALFILLAFSILASFGGEFTFTAFRQAEIPLNWATLTFVLGLIGFGMKAGLVPLHAWLPEAHPVAPSHISALMSGVMLKIAIYGLMRLTFDLLGTPQWQWGMTLLIIGALTALLGILYALVQNDLKRLLAYSSIENMGIISMGLGLSILFLAHDLPQLAVLGLTAALYHTLNHALFKSLLFLGAGCILHTTHEQNLEHMGGLIYRIPYTAFFFLIGCLSISALPPFNGFASEWLTFQTALQAPVLDSGILRTLIPISAALLALTAALSATCFVKAFGIAFLGQPRCRAIRHARETSWGMRLAQAWLATLCCLLGIFPTTFIQFIYPIHTQLLQFSPAPIEGWLWLTPISPQIASYSAPLVLLSIIAVWGIVYLILKNRKKTRRTYPWDCGFGPLNSRMQYTATAFSMPIRRIFKTVWKTEEPIKESIDETLYSREIHHQLHLADRSWPILYEPIINWINYTARQVTRIQTGNIRTYLAYSFFTLLVLLWLIT